MKIFLGPFVFFLALIRTRAAMRQEANTTGKLQKPQRGRLYALGWFVRG